MGFPQASAAVRRTKPGLAALAPAHDELGAAAARDRLLVALELARDPHRADGGEPVPLGIFEQRQLSLQDHGVEIAHRIVSRRPLHQRLHHKGQLHGEGRRTGATGDVLTLLAPVATSAAGPR